MADDVQLRKVGRIGSPPSGDERMTIVVDGDGRLRQDGSLLGKARRALCGGGGEGKREGGLAVAASPRDAAVGRAGIGNLVRLGGVIDFAPSQGEVKRAEAIKGQRGPGEARTIVGDEQLLNARPLAGGGGVATHCDPAAGRARAVVEEKQIAITPTEELGRGGAFAVRSRKRLKRAELERVRRLGAGVGEHTVCAAPGDVEKSFPVNGQGERSGWGSGSRFVAGRVGFPRVRAERAAGEDEFGVGGHEGGVLSAAVGEQNAGRGSLNILRQRQNSSGVRHGGVHWIHGRGGGVGCDTADAENEREQGAGGMHFESGERLIGWADWMKPTAPASGRGWRDRRRIGRV